MNESDYTNKCLTLIKQHYPDWYAFKYVQSGLSKIGVPDVIICIRGRYVALEFKILRGSRLEYSNQQVYNISKIRNCFGIAWGIAIDSKKNLFKIDKEITGQTDQEDWHSLPEVLKLIDTTF